MRGLATDLKQAVRGLARTPWVTGMVIVTLALGIGAPTAVFSVVNAVLLRPLPYPEADRLVRINRVNDRGQVNGSSSGAAFLALREQSRSFAEMASYDSTSFDLRTGSGPQPVRGAIVSPSFFTTFGSASLVGRAATSDAGARQVVLSERLWRRHFGGADDAVGRAIVLGGESFTIAGVMPAGFDFPRGAELWLGARGRVPDHPYRPHEDQSTVWDSNYLGIVARLRDGIDLPTAQAEMNAIGARLSREVPGNMPLLVSLRDALAGTTRAPLLILLGAVSLILLIACANVAHLLLARAMKREHEIAVRVALGANRARVARLFLAESAVLAAVGGALGTLVALWGAPPLVALGPSGLSGESISADARVLGFAAGVSFLAALLSSLMPALSGQPPAEALKQSGRSSSTGSRGRFARSTLLGLEVGLAVVLMAGAALLGRSYLRLHSVEPGFRAEGVLTADLSLPPARYPDAAPRIRFLDQVLADLRARADVELAGAVSLLPMSADNNGRYVGLGRGEDAPSIHADLRIATPDYLTALGVPLRAGRGLSREDTAQAPRVALVNDVFARRAWPGESPLGKTIVVDIDELPATVVGVAGNVLHSMSESEPRPQVYVPYTSEPRPAMSLVVRGRVPPDMLASAVRGAVARVDPDLALTAVETMEQRIASSLDPIRFRTLLFAVAAGLALVLALVGIYGVMVYSVAQRQRELGIRLALGARPGRLVAMVMTQSLRPVAAGIAAGVLASLALARILAGLLFDVSPTDTASHAAIALLAAGTAALACFAAARRVALLGPISAIRSE
jgi:predicted permease